MRHLSPAWEPSAKVLRHFGSLALGMPYLTTMIRQLLAISAGASVGACLRWLLGQGLNALFPAIPPGTLVANLLGGYLIGVALGFFGQHVAWPGWKLLIITGFLGGLTTFSTFSPRSPLTCRTGAWPGPWGPSAFTSSARWP